MAIFTSQERTILSKLYSYSMGDTLPDSDKKTLEHKLFQLKSFLRFNLVAHEYAVGSSEDKKMKKSVAMFKIIKLLLPQKDNLAEVLKLLQTVECGGVYETLAKQRHFSDVKKWFFSKQERSLPKYTAQVLKDMITEINGMVNPAQTQVAQNDQEGVASAVEPTNP